MPWTFGHVRSFINSSALAVHGPATERFENHAPCGACQASFSATTTEIWLTIGFDKRYASHEIGSSTQFFALGFQQFGNPTIDDLKANGYLPGDKPPRKRK
jgi:hypothetical protein